MNPPTPPQPPERAEQTFISALSRPPAEREAYVAAACGDDTVLIEEVRGLLAAHEGAGDFLKTDTPQTERERTPLESEREGERIGRYKLLQEIGEGGFGTVWMAEQIEPVSRRVALKIIKLGMDTREVIARFEAERQALAMMDHPNIAKVLDAGATDKGRPFFVMELVKGMPITKYCDEAGLGTRERLALFGDVCSAINHAHQKGVIHRDIKPSNVMITLHGDKAVVKVIDFGIAKATQGKLTDKTLFTRFEQFVGTPVYMSPEQAAMSGLDVDTRSDIYALGILLYELLTGKTPFDAKSLASAGYEEMRRIIREVEPVKPSSRLSTIVGEERTLLAKARHIEPEKLHRLVEPDLDWIVMKAIEKDRTRRYETANGLALDIQRFLADEPVSATPPSAGYQFRKFARRNKAALRVAAAIAAVLAAAAVVSTWQAVRATRAEKKTAETLAQVTTERDAKELARKDAEGISNFLGAVFRSPDPRRNGREIKVVELLDRSAKKLESDLAVQPAQRARLQSTLGQTYDSLGLYQQAIPLEEKARDYYRATFGPEHHTTLATMHSLAHSYRSVLRNEEALKILEEILPVSRRVNGPEHPVTLHYLNCLGLSYNSVGRMEEAIKMQEEVLAVRRRLSGPEDTETLGAMTNLASSYAEAGRLPEAVALQEQSLALKRRVLPPDHPYVAAALTNLANYYEKTDRHDEAIKLFKEVLALSRKVLGPEHPDTLNRMRGMANSFANAGRVDEALKQREEVLSLSRKVSGPEHTDTLSAMGYLASSYLQAGRIDEAMKLREEVLAIRRRTLGPEHPETARALVNLAFESFYYGRRRAEAVKMLEEHRHQTAALFQLGYFYHDSQPRETEKAILAWSEALEREPDSPPSQYLLGTLLMSSGRNAEAVKPLQAARNGYPGGERGVETRLHLVKILTALGREAEAEPIRKELATLNAAGAGHESKVAILVAEGRTVEALPLLAEASSRKPDDTILAMKVAALQVWFGRNADHAVTSQRMLTWAADTASAEVAERVAKLASIRPEADAPRREAALVLARKAVEVGKGMTAAPWYQLSLGMAEYRSGHYAAAAEALATAAQTASMARGNLKPPLLERIANFYRAMTLFHQGKSAEARALFTATEAQMKPLPADDQNPLADKSDLDDLILWLACKEAKALLAEPSAPGK